MIVQTVAMGAAFGGHRRLSELRTIWSGIIAGLTEWKNRKNSGIVDAEAQALANATILHFTSQIGAVDKAIALAIEMIPTYDRNAIFC